MGAHQFQFLIGGDLVDPHSTATFVTDDPASGEPLAEVPDGDEQDVDAAVSAAREAFDAGWRWSTPDERSTVLRAIADLIHDNSEELIQLDIENNGSARKTFELDVDLATGWLEYYAGLTREIKGETIDTPGNTINFTVREPHGVVAGIIPFNHPFMFAASKIAAALATGNALVLKPSEYTPLSALKLGEYIADEPAVPDGVVNVITGEGATGAMITEHPDVDMIDFQGSAPTGKKVMASAAETVSPVTLELGGKNPAIVFPDVGLDRAIQGCVQGMSIPWQGQSCGSGSRILVHEDVHDEVAAGIAERFEAIRVGHPADEDTDMGAMVSKPHYERVLGYIEEGNESGADLLTGGGPATVEGHDGYYVQPTVFDNVAPDATIAREEIFGPVVSIVPWSEYDEMLEIANGTDYGLTASVWTDNLRTAHETARRLDAGYVWVNQHGPHYMGTPFGGFKQSGIGRLHCMEELYEHTQAKNVNIQLDASAWDWD
jgi:betaine-aldehyde dehydrogenase